MPTYTPNLNLSKPLVNDPIDADVWGNLLNANFDVLDAICPVSIILPYAGLTEPSGWLFPNGREVSRTTYSKLFAVIGTTYGVGDGSTTFNLPDYRGRVLAGNDDMGGLGSAGRLSGVLASTVVGTVGGSQYTQSHSHTVNDSGHVHSHVGLVSNIAGTDVNVQGAANTKVQTGTDGISSALTGITLGTYGAGNAQNVQPSAIVNFIMRY